MIKGPAKRITLRSGRKVRCVVIQIPERFPEPKIGDRFSIEEHGDRTHWRVSKVENTKVLMVVKPTVLRACFVERSAEVKS